MTTRTNLRLQSAVLALAVLCGAAAGPERSDEPGHRERSSRWLPLHEQQAAEYEFFLDADRREKLTFVTEPVYLWTNPARENQEGALFVWTHAGRPLVVGCVFSHPIDGARKVNHEFHSLAAEIVFVAPASAGWQPRGGVAMRPLEIAPKPDPLERRRSLQMRQLARQFSAESTRPWDGQVLRLRLLPHPLYRYQSSAEGVLDGALFAFATDVGTDPEVLLLIEAVEERGEPAWRYVVARFSDLNLSVSRGGAEVWSAARGENDTFRFNADHTYRLLVRRAVVPDVPPPRSATESEPASP